MEYQKKLEQFNAAKSKFLSAERAVVLAKAELAHLRDEVPKLHDGLTSAMARHDVEDASKEDVNEAKTAYEAGCKKLDDAQTFLSAKEKALELFRQKVADSKSQFLKAAYPHYQQKAIPVIEKIADAFTTMADAQRAQDELVSEMKQNNVDPSIHLPGRFAVKLDVEHLRHLYTPDGWLREAAEANDKYKSQNQ